MMSFTWFDKFSDALAEIPDEGQRRELEVAMVEYGAFGAEPQLAFPLSALFAAFREDLDNSRRMRELGARGGRKKKPTAETDGGNRESKPTAETDGGNRESKPNPIQSKPDQTNPEDLVARAGARGFAPPSVAEVREYAEQKGYTFDPESFMAYYAARGWKTARGAPLKDWRAACVTWAKNEGRFGGSSTQDNEIDWSVYG